MLAFLSCILELDAISKDISCIILHSDSASEYIIALEKYLVSRYIKASFIQKVGCVRSNVSKEYIRSLMCFESTLSYILEKILHTQDIYCSKELIFLYQTIYLTFANF